MYFVILFTQCPNSLQKASLTVIFCGSPKNQVVNTGYNWIVQFCPSMEYLINKHFVLPVKISGQSLALRYNKFSLL
ncbi:MAG: hypothetical protein CSA44_00755 [Gammaproteobacteria bacterium]|nr:MAG: hypothetical protein CSA44_00755 [Gammaproteobacteria bacterium]